MKYKKPQIEIFTLIIEDTIANGSARVHTGWDTNNNENAPKETLWEEINWNTSTDFDT